jgi:putative ABC transport system permease protein
MFNYNLKTAFRFIKRNLAFSLINILGLSLGIALVIISMLWIKFEFSFDNFHQNADKIFRVVAQFNYDNNVDNFAGTPAPLGEAMKNDIPEVIDYVRLGSIGRTLVSIPGKQFWEEIDLADPSIFKIFSFKLLSGDPENALKNPNSIIICESKVKKYFGSVNPLGQILQLGYEKTPFTITGIMKDIPDNSQLQFDFLSSFSNLTSNLDWGMWNYSTYILAQNKNSINSIREKLPGVTKKYIKEEGTALHLQPLTSIHLHSNLRNDLPTNRDIKVIYIFVSICFLILIVACINYMNLATARYIRRGKEVGLRKVAGASNSDLTVQFLFESFAMALSAFILAVLLCTLILPIFNSLTGLNMHLESFFHFSSILLLIVLLLLVTFLAGSYPAFILSSLNPASAVHYDFRLANNLSVKGLRKTLVIFQFIVAIVLIGCTIIIQSQLTFIRNKNLGLSPDQVVVVPIFQDDIKLKYELYKNEILTNPSVLNASAVNYFPGTQGFRQNVWWEGLEKNDNSNMMDWIPVDQDFISTLKIELVKGEFFPRNISNKGSTIYVLNESAVKEIGWDDPIGKQFDIVGKGEVVGVVRDFNFKSLHNALEPAALTFYPELFDNLMLKISTGNIPGTLDFLKRKWESFFPQYPFEYSFLSDDFQKMYEKDNTIFRIITYVSLMALFIACIGLFGLVLFSIDQRVKEVGIRKVSGASSGIILLLFNMEFIKRILVSFIISCPIIIYFMQNWLDNFAYRIKLSWWMFAFSGLITLVLSITIVTLLTFYTSTRNPAECLRSEG